MENAKVKNIKIIIIILGELLNVFKDKIIKNELMNVKLIKVEEGVSTIIENS